MTQPALTPTPPAPPANGGVLLECRGVSQRFKLPNGRPLQVLDDVSVQVRANEVVVLLGPSGCGKSTVLRILAGLVRPTQGQVLYHGRPLLGMNPGVGIVFQSFALYPWMTVMENVQAVLQAAGRTSTQVRTQALAAIHKVGLEGFEDVYPRELSGGMKQRVGMARALSVDPEILFMDEPFSQVDALTAESLRAEVIDLWAMKDRNPSSILMVSHDIKEVVYMADRIVVLSANPGRIRTVVENRLPRPRDYRSPEFLKLVDYLHEIITGAEMPDAAALAPGVVEEPTYEAPPDVLPTEIVGLLEYLDARGGRDDVFRIATDTGREFGHLIAVVKAAELLDLVDTPKRQVILAPGGQRFVRAAPGQRPDIWREAVLKLLLFRELEEILQQQPDHEVDRELVLETIIFRLPQEDYEKIFRAVVNWGRFGDLLEYDESTDRLRLAVPEQPVASDK